MRSFLTKKTKWQAQALKQSIFLTSIDIFLQNPGIENIDYLLWVSAHP